MEVSLYLCWMEAGATIDEGPWSPATHVGALVSGGVLPVYLRPLGIDATNGDLGHGDVMKHACRCTMILFAGWAAVSARGDGGRVRMHERAGPFVVTLLSVPDNLVAGPADLSVGIEEAAIGELIDGAEIRLSLSPFDNRARVRSWPPPLTGLPPKEFSRQHRLVSPEPALAR
jgi:hypothetical protein